MLGLSLGNDLRVIALSPEGGGAKGGLRIGDAIISVNDTQVSDKKQCLALLNSSRIVRVQIFRSKIVNIPKKEDEGAGLEMEERGPHVVVVSVRKDSPASRHHDWATVNILKQVNGIPVSKIAQVREAVKAQSLLMLDLLVQLTFALENDDPPNSENEMQSFTPPAVSSPIPPAAAVVSSSSAAVSAAPPKGSGEMLPPANSKSLFGPRGIFGAAANNNNNNNFVSSSSSPIDPAVSKPSSSSPSPIVSDVLVAKAAEDRRMVEKLQEEVRSLSSINASHADVLANKEAEISTLRSELDEARGRRNALGQRASQDPRDKVELIDTIERQKNLIETQKREISHLKAEQTATDSLIKSLEEQVLALKQERNALMEEKRRLVQQSKRNEEEEEGDDPDITV